MNNPTMLYKHPGVHEVHGDYFDHIIVDASEVDENLAKGWYLTTPEAKANSANNPAPEPKEAEPTKKKKD